MSADDWTVATDDLLVSRLRTCTGCGEKRPGTVSLGIYPGRPAVAYLLCARCAHTDRRAMEGLLAARYAPQGDADG
jgi:hypothetical protein